MGKYLKEARFALQRRKNIYHFMIIFIIFLVMQVIGLWMYHINFKNHFNTKMQQLHAKVQNQQYASNNKYAWFKQQKNKLLQLQARQAKVDNFAANMLQLFHQRQANVLIEKINWQADVDIKALVRKVDFVLQSMPVWFQSVFSSCSLQSIKNLQKGIYQLHSRCKI